MEQLPLYITPQQFAVINPAALPEKMKEIIQPNFDSFKTGEIPKTHLVTIKSAVFYLAEVDCLELIPGKQEFYTFNFYKNGVHCRFLCCMSTTTENDPLGGRLKWTTRVPLKQPIKF